MLVNASKRSVGPLQRLRAEDGTSIVSDRLVAGM
jgi:hypothetical protein